MEVNGIKKIADEFIPTERTQDKKGKTPVSQEKAKLAKEKFEPSPLLDVTRKLIHESGGVRSERIKEVKDRISKGYYDKEEVKEEAIQNLLRFLGF